MSDDRDRRTLKTPPKGIRAQTAAPVGESWEESDHLTPVAEALPDSIEEAALRIDRRATAIRRRPGPTPATESVAAAITIHGVNASLDGVKKQVSEQGLKIEALGTQMTQLVPVLLGELTKDGEVRRQEKKARIDWVTRLIAILATIATGTMIILQARHC